MSGWSWHSQTVIETATSNHQLQKFKKWPAPYIECVREIPDVRQSVTHCCNYLAKVRLGKESTEKNQTNNHAVMLSGYVRLWQDPKYEINS